MKRPFGFATDLAALVLLLWAGISALPLTIFWFDPGPVVVPDSAYGTVPDIGFTRKIHRDVTMKYSVTMRDEDLTVVCEDRSEPFRYRKESAFPEDADLAWWAPGDQRCHRPLPGIYIIETCWTATDRLFGLLLDRTVCRESNVFKIT